MGALAPLGYRVTIATDSMAVFERRHKSAANLIWLLIPIIGWAIFLLSLFSPGVAQTITLSMRWDDPTTAVGIKADDPRAADFFEKWGEPG